MKKHALVLPVLLALLASAAMAQSTSRRACVDEAREELHACSAECINDFRNERFVCRNVEPGCGRECLGRREGCIEIANEPLVECLGGCRASLIDAKAVCAQNCNADQSCRDTCIDAAQVDAFTCRDDCREDFRASGGPDVIAVCRATFRECVRACPPAQ